MKNKNKYVVSGYLNTLLSSFGSFNKYVNDTDLNYGQDSPVIFDELNLEKRKKSVNSLRSIRHFNILYAYNKKDQKSFHDIYDPNFSKSGYLNKPLSMIIPFLYSEDLIKK